MVTLAHHCECTFFFFTRLYLFIHERQRHRQRERHAPCGEPDVGLDPRTSGSCPEPKAEAQPLNHPGAPVPPASELQADHITSRVSTSQKHLLPLHPPAGPSAATLGAVG